MKPTAKQLATRRRNWNKKLLLGMIGNIDNMTSLVNSHIETLTGDRILILIHEEHISMILARNHLIDILNSYDKSNKKVMKYCEVSTTKQNIIIDSEKGG